MKLRELLSETRHSGRDAYERDYDSSVSGMGRGDDHRGLSQELAHETNNIAVAINGKTWKVMPGKGYADSKEEWAYLNHMKNWAEKKSASSGKKWTVHLTGAPVTEQGVAEGEQNVAEGSAHGYNVTKFYRKFRDQSKITKWLKKEAGLPKETKLYFDDADLVLGSDTIVPYALVDERLKFNDLLTALVKVTGGTSKEKVDGVYRDQGVVESATAGATSSANIGTVDAPQLSPGKARGKKSYLGSPSTGSGTKAPPQPKVVQPKNSDGTAKNGLDMKGANLFGAPIKR